MLGIEKDELELIEECFRSRVSLFAQLNLIVSKAKKADIQLYCPVIQAPEWSDSNLQIYLYLEGPGRYLQCIDYHKYVTHNSARRGLTCRSLRYKPPRAWLYMLPIVVPPTPSLRSCQDTRQAVPPVETSPLSALSSASL
jgi:hypothetical protein